MEEIIEVVQEENDYDQLQIVVDPGQQPIRIDHFLAEKIARVSRNKIQNALRAGLIKLNNKEVKSNYKLRPNDIIDVVIPRPPIETEIIPEDIPLDVIYEDDTMVVINKSQGMVVHPAAGVRTGTLVNTLAWHFGFRDKSQVPEGKERFGLLMTVWSLISIMSFSDLGLGLGLMNRIAVYDSQKKNLELQKYSTFFIFWIDFSLVLALPDFLPNLSTNDCCAFCCMFVD